MWAYTQCDAGLPDILVLQVQQFAWPAFKGLLTVPTILGPIDSAVQQKCCLAHFVPYSIRELFAGVMHQSSESNLIWCARAKALPSPSVLYGLRPHKTLKKSDLKNNLISHPKLITHGLLAVHASKSKEWGIGNCCWGAVLDDNTSMKRGLGVYIKGDCC